MSTVGQKECQTQARVIKLFREQLDYEFLGNWIDRENNRNIEESLLRGWLKKRGVSEALITRALHQLDKAAALSGGKSLYDVNRMVYELLRYGVKVKEGAGEQHQTVWLIDWKNPEKNHFAIAEEVSIKGELTKRPDIVLYVNGIALGVLELKRSTVSVSEGIRQNLDNQKKTFIRPFFSTMQLVMAGNDTEGVRYGTIETPQKYYLTWKETSDIQSLLDRHLIQLCNKRRLLELIHDFIVFDAGVKKTCRHNQYFGVKAAQERVERREGGIVWHTQGSGKSLTMVWLTKWIREHVQDARVLIITDRTELDEQIESVYRGVDEDIYRTQNSADLIARLNASTPWLMCSLIHKFGRSEEGAVDEFIVELQKNLPSDFKAKGEFFVFVDECHRTQSGKLHKAMKTILPKAMFIGFTGTPLLKADKQQDAKTFPKTDEQKSTVEIFGSYIHTYKFDEAVGDGVVLDLRYEARDIDQTLTSPQKVDQWFNAKTRGFSDLARAQLKQRWGSMRRLFSSQSRLEKIAADILFDMETRDRLMSGRGNAMLVSSSIYQACKLFELFAKTHLAGKCAIITSYKPSPANIKGEESGEGLTEKLCQYEIYRKMLADYFDEPADKAMYRAEEFEQKVKEKFVKEPGQMKLLIVVDKLLTGFDAPPATYLYIDKQMRDHGLFQAICRVNRLDGDDKEYGYIIDYRDLFQSLAGAFKDYTGKALDGYDAADVAGLLKDRLEKARERLEETRETVKALCEPVLPPQDTPAYLHYFCAANTEDKRALKDNEPKRLALYKVVAAYLRAYAAIANEMPDAGYSSAKIEKIRHELAHYEKVREEVKVASSDFVDMKVFEPAMRHLLDTYVQAEDSKVISTFDEISLVELLVEQGQAAVDKLPEGIRKNDEAVAETIENNLRKLIIDEQPINPKYYDNMSELLDALIQERRQKAQAYEEYLQKLVELCAKVKKPAETSAYPPSLDTSAKQALYDNLSHNEVLAIQIDTAVRYTKKSGWRGHRIKEREVMNAIREEMGSYTVDQNTVQDIFELVKNQREY